LRRSDAECWTRARRHLLKYGGEFVDFVPVRAEGAFLYVMLAAAYLDFTSDWMSAMLGHSHPEIVATVEPLHIRGSQQQPRCLTTKARFCGMALSPWCACE
jgi:4-aminobutyrate aminotransferase-like enzyme